MPSYLNLSKLLVRWMKQIHLPRTEMRMQYVQMFHALHVLTGHCSHDILIEGMQTLLQGWVRSDEGDEGLRAGVDCYHARLRAAIAEVQARLMQRASDVNLPRRVVAAQ